MPNRPVFAHVQDHLLIEVHVCDVRIEVHEAEHKILDGDRRISHGVHELKAEVCLVAPVHVDPTKARSHAILVWISGLKLMIWSVHHLRGPAARYF